MRQERQQVAIGAEARARRAQHPGREAHGLGLRARAVSAARRAPRRPARRIAAAAQPALSALTRTGTRGAAWSRGRAARTWAPPASRGTRTCHRPQGRLTQCTAPRRMGSAGTLGARCGHTTHTRPSPARAPGAVSGRAHARRVILALRGPPGAVHDAAAACTRAGQCHGSQGGAAGAPAGSQTGAAALASAGRPRTRVTRRAATSSTKSAGARLAVCVSPQSSWGAEGAA